MKIFLQNYLPEKKDFVYLHSVLGQLLQDKKKDTK